MSFSRPRTVRIEAGSEPIAAPLVLDRYRLSRRLGAGAFGTVWMARDERLERDVAVKILAREIVSQGRFEREARAAARLSHPGIVTLFEAAVDDEGAYLVSELVLGDTLDVLLVEGRLSDRDIVAIGAALCDALEHAHGQGVVHRDVKPSNVLVPTAPAKHAAVAKLTDFGVARVIDSDSLTQTGDVVGTLAYMAPEQAAGLEAAEAADLYSVALVLYEALTGVNPVRTTPAAQRARRLGAHLPPLRRQRRELPGALGQAIDLALRPRAQERGSIAELRHALAQCSGRVDDEPGVVTGAWTPIRRAEDDEDDGDQGAHLWRSRDPRDPLVRRRDVEPSRDPGPSRDSEPDPSRLIWQARALAGAATAAIAVWLSTALLAPGRPGSLPLALLALLAGGLCVAAPRLGWLATVAYLCGAAAVQGRGGGSLVLALAALVPIVALPASPCLWPVGAAGPALGLIGLGGGWPAIAGWARSPWRRMMLGAIGWLWLLVAGPLAGRTLYLPNLPGTLARGAWIGSPADAITHLLAPLTATGALAPAAVWAAGAVIAPWMVRGRSGVLDVARAVVWSATLAGATAVAVIAVHGSDRVSGAPSAAAGAVAAAILALAPLGVRSWHGRSRRPGSAAEVS